MMYAESTLPLFDANASTPVPVETSTQAVGFGEPARRGRYVASTSSRRQRFVRSVVEAAGLGSFAYLQGVSGKRYVFSAVRGNQVSLYNRAVFALASADGVLERIVTRSELTQCPQAAFLYVHLLDDCSDATSIIEDMSTV